MNRRSLLTLTIGTVAAQALPAPITRAQMVSSAWYHGVSPFGDLKYPSGFKQFDYVNAKAPKGGAARQIALGTYDNFNMWWSTESKAPSLSVLISTMTHCWCPPSTKYRAHTGSWLR